MASIQIPSKAVSTADDLREPTCNLLQALSLLGSEADTKAAGSPGAIFSGLPVHAKTPQHISTANGMVLQTSQAGQFFGPIALAWLASHYGGWDATLWAMLAFAAGGALCGFALTRIERSMRR